MIERYITWRDEGNGVGSVTEMYSGTIPLGLSGGKLITVEDPEIINYPNLKPVLKINIEAETMYYDYVSEDTTESRLALTQAELTQVQQALADTYEQLAIAQIESTTTQQALSDLYEQLLQLQEEMATLKGGGE